jgi:hypothetical protein
MKRFRHLFCRKYYWMALDIKKPLWRVKCTKCGYTKELANV